MSSIHDPSSPFPFFRGKLRKGIRVFLATMALFSTSACDHMTSPHWGQELSSRDEEVPIQVWSGTPDREIVVQCAPASSHGWPYDGESSYQTIATLRSSNTAILDSSGSMVFPATGKIRLPRSCWRRPGFQWITNLRVSGRRNDGKLFPVEVYDKAGLACLGRAAGRDGWAGAFHSECEKRYLGTRAPIPYIVLRVRRN